MKRPIQQVGKSVLRRAGGVVALVLLLAPFVHGQTSQFLFDANGNLATQSAATSGPPQIVRQPQNQVVAPGEVASFSVVVADTRALSYQWRFNGNPIIGATGEALLRRNFTTSDEGQYTVVLTNPSGSVTSAPAMLMLDSDADGLGDGWEQTYFGTLGRYPTADSDGDGVSNGTEFQDGTDPNDSASAFFRLTLLSDGGQVTVTPGRFRFTNGETVTLTATAFSPHSFHGWAGDIEATNNPITLTMTNNKTLVAYLSSYDIQWRSGANGDWHNRANWNPRIVPASNDNVFVTGAGQITNNSDVVCRNLMVGGPGSAPTLWGSGNLRVVETCDWLGGTLAGSGVLTVPSEMNWAGGTMSGSGRTVISPGATLNIANPTDVTLRTRTLENAGTILWTGTRIFVDGGVITNRPDALFEVQNASFLAFISGAAIGRFDNAGTFRKTSPGATSFDTTTPFNNYAAVEIQNGVLAVRGGGRNEGLMEFQAGTTLNLGGSTFTSSAASSITGAANLTVSGGTANLAGLVNLEGTHTFSAGSANLTGNYICTNNTLIVSGGVANFSGTGVIMPSIVSLSSGGSLAGSSVLTVLSEFNWSGGTMSGSGRTVIAPGAVFNIISSAVHFLSGGRTLDNGGTILWNGGFLTMGGATITNRAGALFELQTAVTIGSGGGNRFDNAGRFRKSVNAGTATWPLAFNNSGVVEVQTGRLTLGGGGAHSGAFEIAAGASLNLSAGTHAANAASIITGAGDFLVSGATATLAGVVNPGGTHTFSAGTANLNGSYICTNNPATISGGTVNFNTNSAVAVLNLSSGTLGGSGLLTLLNALNWSGGSMIGSGRTFIAPSATLNLINPITVLLTSRTLENAGTVLCTGAGGLNGSAGVITNRPGALFEVRNNSSFAPQGFVAWRFDNAGIFRKVVGSGTSTFAAGVIFNNYGRVEIRSGILAASGGYTSRVDSVLNCAIGGTGPGTNFGQLRVAGTVNLNGSLSVDLINGFIPATNDSFAVLTAGTRSGTFVRFSYPTNEVTMQMSNTPTSVIVRVIGVSPPRPTLLHPELSGSNVNLTWTAISNITYRLEFTSDPGLTNWNAFPGDVTSLSNRASRVDTLTTSNRFYRVRMVP